MDTDIIELHELEPAAEWRSADVAEPEAWTLRLSAGTTASSTRRW